MAGSAAHLYFNKPGCCNKRSTRVESAFHLRNVSSVYYTGDDWYQASTPAPGNYARFSYLTCYIEHSIHHESLDRLGEDAHEQENNCRDPIDRVPPFIRSAWRDTR